MCRAGQGIPGLARIQPAAQGRHHVRAAGGVLDLVQVGRRQPGHGLALVQHAPRLPVGLPFLAYGAQGLLVQGALGAAAFHARDEDRAQGPPHRGAEILPRAGDVQAFGAVLLPLESPHHALQHPFAARGHQQGVQGVMPVAGALAVDLFQGLHAPVAA